MESRLRGQTALVTGATSGIGKAVAERLAAAGVHLVLAARRAERLDALSETLISSYGVRVRTYRLDVRERAAVEAFAAKLEEDGIRPDILVNNAGLARGLEPFYKGNPDDWDEMIDTNLKGLMYVSRAIVPGMVERNRGHVINIGSIAGLTAYPNGAVYNATKFGVRAITDAMNMDLLGTDVRVACVAPGMVDTEFSLVRFHGDKDRADNVYQGVTPLSAEDVADAVVYVLSAPPHVNTTHVVIYPTAQRSATLVSRKG